MAVFRRKVRGEFTEKYYYDFKINNERYRGCTHKTVKREALAFENELKEEVKAIKKEPDDKSQKESLLRFRDSVTAKIQGESIAIEDVWERFKKESPAKMKRIPNQDGWTSKESIWNDFAYFLYTNHSSCKTLREVTPAMAQEYIGFVKVAGKFNKTIGNGEKSSYQSKLTKLSSSTINNYIVQLRQIFRIMSDSASLLENPFVDVQKLTLKQKSRDVFEVHELEKIFQYIKKLKESDFLPANEKLNLFINEAIYTIGINTGLRKADMCLLKWSEVSFSEKTIKRELLKTRERVCIPLTLPLYSYLRDREKFKDGEFVNPEIAKMYLENEEGIGTRFKNMLKELGIECLKAYEGRSRRSSNKDIHSLRHSFCYLHGMQGTPLVTVQSMVGHMDKKMTEAYMMHETEELKRSAIEKFALQPFQTISLNPNSQEKNELINLIKNCNSESLVKEFLSFVKDRTQEQNRNQGYRI